MEFPAARVIEKQLAATDAAFPYIPGLLSFREMPPLLKAFEQVQTTPDVVILDAQGYAHPRRLGLASHMGLFLQRPTIGCAKSRLIGQYTEPPLEKGSMAPLFDNDDRIGMVLRSRDRVKPLFVSCGHLIDLESSVRIVLETCRRYRLPEPTRLAHIEAGKYKKIA